MKRLPRSVPMLALLSMAVFFGCENTGPTTSDKDLMHIEYRQLVELLSRVSSRTPVVLIDTRSPEQFAKGHIDGAINMPLGEVNPRDPRLAKGTVILYHEDFKGAYADIAAKKLLSNGLTNVLSYAGGYNDWISRKGEGGLPVPPSEDGKK